MEREGEDMFFFFYFWSCGCRRAFPIRVRDVNRRRVESSQACLAVL